MAKPASKALRSTGSRGPRSVTSFLLVPSPLTGPYIWQPVAEILATDHEVAVAGLTTPANPASTYWEHHVDEVLAAAAELPAGPIEVVAHSGSGPLVPLIGSVLKQAVER